MKDPDKAIICGACQIPVVSPTDPEPDAQIVCSRCGARDAYKQVWDTCMEEVKDRFQRATARGLAKLDRKLGNPSRSQSFSDVEKPVFKWKFRD